MNRRVTNKAVMTDVTIPLPSVVAKPRTGPDPTNHKLAAVINVVTFAARIADYART
jgi:hypothetical protein